MASSNQDLWQSILFLFLSKFVKQANTPFARKDLINAKNVELAGKFAEMVGDKTPAEKMKLTMNKALKSLVKHGFAQEIDDATLQLTDSGMVKMHEELKIAMAKIAQNFPQTQTPGAPKAN
jgi:hypothetical protein